MVTKVTAGAKELALRARQQNGECNGPCLLVSTYSSVNVGLFCLAIVYLLLDMFIATMMKDVTAADRGMLAFDLFQYPVRLISC